jgi:hypothetical protein
MAFIYDLSDTWNNAGISFNGIKLNATDTASASGSKLIDLQINGASKFTVGKTGNVIATGLIESTVGGFRFPDGTTQTTKATVNSVSGTGTVNGITLTGSVIDSGSLTLGGTLGNIANSQLTNSAITINGTSTALGGSISVGTVTSVAALTLGTSGTDLASSVANGTTTPVVTLNVPTASAANRGALSPSDWSTFNAKQAALVSGTNIKTVGGASLLGSGDVGTIGLAYGGTGATTESGARTNLGLGTAAVLNSGVANGVATLDGSGTVPTSQLPGAVLGGLNYQGIWNASTNTPTLASSTGSKGYYYVVSTAGSTNLNGITDWKIGDWAVYDGSSWQKVDNTDAVSSVNGFTGAVVLTTSNVAQGTNLYFTQAAARGSVSAGTGISYNSTTGVITNSAPDQTVALTGAGTTTVTGTYPNFTITSNDSTVGTVTSVAASGGTTGLTFTGSPITTSGTLTLGGTLAMANGGTGATTAAGARTALGLGTAATTDASAYATAAQGAKADTAVQTIASADGSVTITGTTAIDLSVPVTAATNSVLLPVRNTTGATLTKGTAVYISGATGQISTVSKALATSDATSAQTLGLITANLANNSDGNVTLIGTITNIDTSAYTDGQQLYLSPTTAGTLTATKPYAPQHLVYMAVVEHAHPSQGKLFVKVQNGYEMDELHDVSAQSPANNDGLFYNTATSLWEKKSIVTALGYTPYNATNPAGYTTNTGTVSSVNLTAGTGVSVSGGPITSSGAITVTNTAPDQVVSLTGAGTTTVTGTYPNFTVTSNDSATGTVTSVGGTGTVSGLTLTGNVTTSGNLTLGGTLSLTSGNVTTALGYTPANKAGDTFTGNVIVNGNTTLGDAVGDLTTIPNQLALEYTTDSLPATRPAFSLDFVDVGALDPRVTFTRGTTATFVGSNGFIQTAAINGPRFDYNPVTLAAKGLLIEEQRTNLLTYSEQFDNAAWSKVRSSVTNNAATSPDGTSSADKFVIDTTAAANHSTAQTVSVVSGSTYTFTVYAKASEFSQINLRFPTQFPVGNCTYDLIAGTTTVGGTIGSASMANAGNGWWRCTLVGTANATGSSSGQIFLAQGGSITIATADGVSGVFLWGAQVEAGAFATSYIPTVASTVTRSADVATMTGTNFSSWYNQSEGTIVASVLNGTPAGTSNAVLSFQDGAGSSNNRNQMSGYTAFTATVVGGAVQSNMGTNTSASANLAYAYKANDFAASANGATPTTDTSGTVPSTLAYATIGRFDFGSVVSLNGCIRRITYYPQRLPNATLQALTS